MFSKKKPDTQPQAENMPANPMAGGRSLFAPGLNPMPSPLSFDQPMYSMPIQTDWAPPVEENPAFSVDVPAPPPLQWDPTPPAPEILYSPAPEAAVEPMIPDVMPSSTWQPEPLTGEPQAYEMPTWTEPVAAAEPTSEITSFDEAVETPQNFAFEQELPPLPPELYQAMPSEHLAMETPQDALPAWDMPDLGQPETTAVYTPPPSPEAEPLTWEASLPVDNSFESSVSLNTGMDDSWNTWETPMTQGDPGAFLDNVNQQLYPEDPFVDPAMAVEGAQAFEEAAQFLFPETVSAMPDWQPEEPVAMFGDDPFAMDAMEADPLELGPSYQPEPGNLNDLSAFEVGTESDIGTFIDPFEETPVSVTPTISEPPDFGLPDLPGLSAHQAILSEPSLTAAYEMGDEGLELPISEGLSAAFEDAYAFSEQETVNSELLAETDWSSEVANAPAWGTGIEPSLPEGIYVPPESVEEDYFSNSWESNFSPELTEEINALAALLPSEEPEKSVVPVQPEPEPPPADSLEAFLSDDDDFYASSFTVTEQGDVLPAYDLPKPIEASPLIEEPIIQLESPNALVFEQNSTPEETSLEQPVSFNDAELTWMPSSEESLPELAATSEETWFAEEPTEPAFQSMEDFGSPPPLQEETQWEIPAAPLGSSEALWESPPTVEEPVSTEPVAPALAMDQLEILGVCPLTQDKRLLLVHSAGQFALMGQVGFDNPNVSVLKIFEDNPVAYQQTFAAAQEGQAGEQGMFVTQVGTWHAIVSTFRDQIVLHTELG